VKKYNFGIFVLLLLSTQFSKSNNIVEYTVDECIDICTTCEKEAPLCGGFGINCSRESSWSCIACGVCWTTYPEQVLINAFKKRNG
jgi:NAD-dependent dihydropyrimidine dehydrogenase PreA subunit